MNVIGIISPGYFVCAFSECLNYIDSLLRIRGGGGMSRRIKNFTHHLTSGILVRHSSCRYLKLNAWRDWNQGTCAWLHYHQTKPYTRISLPGPPYIHVRVGREECKCLSASHAFSRLTPDIFHLLYIWVLLVIPITGISGYKYAAEILGGFEL